MALSRIVHGKLPAADRDAPTPFVNGTLHGTLPACPPACTPFPNL
jgi:hypothetical protein